MFHTIYLLPMHRMNKHSFLKILDHMERDLRSYAEYFPSFVRSDFGEVYRQDLVRLLSEHFPSGDERNADVYAEYSAFLDYIISVRQRCAGEDDNNSRGLPPAASFDFAKQFIASKTNNAL